MYCENCHEEDLTDYVEDELGGIFCSVKCFKEFPYQSQWALLVSGLGFYKWLFIYCLVSLFFYLI